MAAPPDYSEADVAIVGMAGRFPGAADVDALWERVAAGHDCLTDIALDDLLRARVPRDVARSSSYVRRSGVVAGVDMFDPGFFGIGQRDAAVMDPQTRLFLECTWEALESAGHVPERFDGAIGVFAGCGANTYLLNNLLTNPSLVEQMGWFLLRHTGNDKDFLPTTVSYRLDLRGPSISVQTACSTSLVAIHLAAQSLVNFECDLALAGGVTIEVPHGVGYRYMEGEILSPDGRCRAFDAESSGTVLTSGAGVVALRRITDALAERDPILAVIRGTAVNNDGARKVGYLAPSVDGHADVVKEALAVVGLSASDIQLVEGHGTGTAVGDPIEFAALTEAFRATTDQRNFCRLVSTKPNIGHLDTAAGVASVIKVVQALRHATLPPLANHTAPSPLLDLERSPFVLSGTAAEWPGDAPRRAGISSLGVGGTNAHVILEEAPPVPASPPAVDEQILCISGRDDKAIADASERLARHLERTPENLADVSYTLATGRRAMQHRRVVTVTDADNAMAELRRDDRRRSFRGVAADQAPTVVFMFPGGGSQYAGMAAGFDHRFSAFHDSVALGVERVRALGGMDLAPLLTRDVDPEALRQPEASLPAVFVTSLALARQWMAWGVQPSALVGHSLGEYVAAHLAGVMSLDDALTLVLTRAELMARTAAGNAAMAAVPLGETEVSAILPTELSLATVNASDECVVAGPRAAVDAFAAHLAGEGVNAVRIPLAAAAHSSLLDPVLDEFRAAASRVSFRPPTLRYTSNLTGRWIEPSQATDAEYWVRHLRGTVRFDDCLATVLEEAPTVFVELGPGQALSSYARRQRIKPVAAIPALRHPDDATPDAAHTLQAFAKQWAVGVDVDLAPLAGSPSDRRRLRLPTYPFQRERFWIEPGERRTTPTPTAEPDTDQSRLERIDDIDDWFWIPAWAERSEIQPTAPPPASWLVVGEPSDPLVAQLAHQLESREASVRILPRFAAEDVDAAGAVVFVAGAIDPGFDAAMHLWLTDAVDAARQLGNAADQRTRLAVVTRGATTAGGLAVRPADALALGPVLVGPREYPGLSGVLVDIDPAASADVAAAVADDLLAGSDPVVAHRQGRRLVPTAIHTPVPVGTGMGVRPGGTYVVTGGLGDVGFEIARHLALVHRANLIVVSSSAVPHAAEADDWLATHGSADPTSRRIRRVRELEAAAPKAALVVADLADPAALRQALDEGERQVGPIDGVIHAAGQLRDRLIELVATDDHEAVVGVKARAALVLADELATRGSDLLVLVSSTSTTIAAPGQVSYVAANSVLDALAGRHERLRIATLNSGAWATRGMAAGAARRLRLGIEPGEPVTHPVLSERTVDRDGTCSFTGRLALDTDWIVDEHRTPAGAGVLPGTGHLELLLAAASLAGVQPPQLLDVDLLEPLIVHRDHPVTIRVSVGTADDTRRHRLLIESDRGSGREWTTHAEAYAVEHRTDRQTVDIAATSAPCHIEVDPLAAPRAHLALGPRWDCIEVAARNDDVACGRLVLPAGFVREAVAWRAHPAVVDAATAVAVSLRAGLDDRLWIPVHYECVTLHSQVPHTAHAVVRRRPGSPAESLIVDLSIVTDAGDVALSIDGLTLRPLGDAASFVDESSASTPPRGTHPQEFFALVDGLGIQPSEGVEVFDRLVASEHSRVIASSVDLEDLVGHDQPELPAPAQPAGEGDVSTVPAAIEAMWSDLLGVSPVPPGADFFDLGGHSLIAIRLMSRIHRELGVRLPLSSLFDAPTVDGLARLVLAERPELDLLAGDAGAAAAARPAVPRAERSLVPIRPGGSARPLYIVHGAGGNVLFLWTLARAMSSDRPLYGFQAKGIDGSEMPDTSVEAMAARYVEELRAHSTGPYLLGGYSGGGIVALEMARQLTEVGDEVAVVVLFDSVPPGRAEPPRRRLLANLSGHVARAGLRSVRPYLRSVVKNWVHRLVPQRPDRTHDDVDLEVELGYRDVGNHGFVNLYYYFTAAANRYECGIYDVDTIVLRADLVWPTQPPDYYWTGHVKGRLQLRSVPGDHHSMFAPQNTPAMAAVLQPLLEEYDCR